MTVTGGSAGIGGGIENVGGTVVLNHSQVDGNTSLPGDPRQACPQRRPRLVAFFAVMYYAGLRPEEAINLGTDNLILPPRVWDGESQQWQGPPDDPSPTGAPGPVTAWTLLLRIYAKCVEGQDELAKRRISEALCQD